MTLKIRFLLLIIGTFFIPNILIMLIVYLSFGNVDNMKTTHQHFKEYYQLAQYTGYNVDKEEFTDFIMGLPEYMDSRFLFRGEIPSSDIFEKLISENQATDEVKISLEIVPIYFTDGGSGVLLVNMPSVDKYSVFRNTPFPFIFPLILISVMTILSVFMIRSINSSLKKIEEATSRVAEGDFEFELTAKGSDSIASLTRSFDIMRRKVKEEYDRRARFFMGVSHDLKTPLASISGYADAVLEGYAEDKETLYKYMEIIKDKSNILNERVTHLIHFVKLETGEWKAALTKVDLKKFLNEITGSFATEAEIQNFEFVSKININDNTFIDMDAGLVTRSLENLIHNTFRYSYPKSRILFTVNRESSFFTISICNKSEGINKEDIINIFEPFYRGSKGRNDEGFGLGLANVAAVIKSHGWEIGVESIPEKDTTFTINIPILNK
jgi:signal transduction histidine kinase